MYGFLTSVGPFMLGFTARTGKCLTPIKIEMKINFNMYNN